MQTCPMMQLMYQVPRGIFQNTNRVVILISFLSPSLISVTSADRMFLNATYYTGLD